jgi:hypothetical protein
MMTPTAGRLRWMFQKNRHILDSLLLRRAPEFVYRRSARPLRDEIPVFTFHTVVPEVFEAQCQFLARNGYRTLSAEEFHHRLTGQETNTEPAVLLTFDDGLKHVWSVAFPLLQKYGLQATCFLIPGCIPDEDDGVRSTLEDVWRGSAEEADVVAIRPDEPAVATWSEIRRMHESGGVDFHSHTMYHALVPASDRIVDFVGPEYDPYFYGNVHVPLYTRAGEDVTSRDPLPGLPIFYAEPRMQAARRFYPDEDLIEECTALASRSEPEVFFGRPDWRRQLQRVVERYASRMGSLGRFETPAERDRAVREELAASRHEIERRLPEGRVNHLCYPWYDAAAFAVTASREVGYDLNYFGLRRGRPTNRPGQDPFGVVRVEEIFLERLPGVGRKTLPDLFRQMLAMRSLPGRLFPDEVRT